MLEIEVLHPGTTVGQKLHDPQQFPSIKENQNPAPQMASNFSRATNEARNFSSRNTVANQSMNSSMQDGLTHPISSLSPYQNK